MTPHIPDTNIEPRATTSTGGRIARLVRTGTLAMAFQPIVSLDSGDVIAFEALARPTRDFDSAADVFAAAEREGMVPALDRFAHTLAFAAASYLASDALLFINAAPETVAQAEFAPRIQRLAQHAGISVARVVIELTESADPEDGGQLARSVDDLRSRGLGFALDDIGAGQSDLGRILKFRPAWIKLDRSLVQRLDTDPYSRSLAAALARFASQNSIRIVAEGIELPSQARAVADLGVSLAQGFWFAHPLALGDAASARCPERVQRRWCSARLAA